MIAWYSNAEGRNGLWVQQVLPSKGPRTLVPGSVLGGKSLAIDQQTAIEARLGAPGVYLAYCSGYPTCKRASPLAHRREAARRRLGPGRRGRQHRRGARAADCG